MSCDCVMTILLVATLLTLYVNPTLSQTTASTLPPLDESKVQVHWISKGEPAPFDGILLNEYTYERMRLKLLEGSP